MSFWGDHATLVRAIHEKIGQINPSSMFFRITNPKMEHALIHSDREYGEITAIVYLSPQSTEASGTAFYRHRETGMTDMPPLDDLIKDPPFFQKLRQQMLDASEADWEMHNFIPAIYNRFLVFYAPMIHFRIPKTGFGATENDSRLVWVCHFCEAK